ncbi:SAM-dependent methyltransferase [Achromobacter sp. DMS1]|uniref:SAM-dependent methyltransferase n=1 Tax=Achromobacter sp. DMS1 TaxID=1688405 RepID=UPI000AC13ADF|nr:SAM-dependent methyltransferase [Achromobacter sp. DMS1]
MIHPVFLIGAGPGDPELLTIKAVKALRQAEIVLADDLVNPEVLAHCPQARVIPVGKRGGCRSTPQDFIQRLMLRYARQGRKVARLKGGDPCIFGRGGEEAAWLAARGVPCEIGQRHHRGPGRRDRGSASPLTLRGVARGVTLVTAHTEDGGAPDWAASPARARPWWSTWAWPDCPRPPRVCWKAAARRHRGRHDRARIAARPARNPL